MTEATTTSSNNILLKTIQYVICGRKRHHTEPPVDTGYTHINPNQRFVIDLIQFIKNLSSILY